MGEIADYWHLANRAIAEQKELSQLDGGMYMLAIMQILYDRGEFVEFRALSKYHLRIFLKGRKVLDYFTTSGKWHHLVTGERGRINSPTVESVWKLITKHIKDGLHN